MIILLRAIGEGPVPVTEIGARMKYHHLEGFFARFLPSRYLTQRGLESALAELKQMGLVELNGAEVTRTANGATLSQLRPTLVALEPQDITVLRDLHWWVHIQGIRPPLHVIEQTKSLDRLFWNGCVSPSYGHDGVSYSVSSQGLDLLKASLAANQNR